MRNVLAHAGKQGRRVVDAFIATAFAQEDAETARRQWRQVADQIRPKVAKLAALMDAAETGVLAFMSFPKPVEPEPNRDFEHAPPSAVWAIFDDLPIHIRPNLPAARVQT
jgi:transposase-like protein